MNGHIRNRGHNTWQLIYELPRDTDGRRQQGRRAVHGPKNLARGQVAGDSDLFGPRRLCNAHAGDRGCLPGSVIGDLRGHQNEPPDAAKLP